MPAVNKKLQTRANQVCKCFEVSQDLILRGVDYFIDSCERGLETDDDPTALMMIPTYVTSIPTGHEQGVLLAVDLGGTNFRVVSVTLKGDHTFSLVQAKSPIPLDMMSGTSAMLFQWMSEKIDKFLKTHHSDSLKEGNNFKMGFTFSFPVKQKSLNSGTLTRWTKGFDVSDCVGKDVVALLQEHLDALKVPVTVGALANDTVGTLLARSYTGANKEGETIIGCIFGTGTNGAYAEDVSKIKKLPEDVRKHLKEAGVTQMVINTEWGSFDNQMKILPNTKWDQVVDKNSSNPGVHIFEKRVSGLYMGETLRVVLFDLWKEGLLFKDYATEEALPHRLTTPFNLDTEAMSLFEIDDSTGLKASELKLQQMLRLPTTTEERLVIQQLTRAIAHRSAYLAAIPISALLMKVGAFDGHHVEVDVGADGSVVEFYPGYRTMMRDAVSLTQLGPKGERRLHINISKDGSSVGAALCALSEE
ncbi:hypothetical protein FOA43_003183 [Brettanomyces nanus]|uniref:Phosphotransferase n=1 Tax=Eeniella nana TaxID=13502 RepID=A0A875S270_EENNA|nr:uncharacterized protein FOA43_003183 [Brettanomyces nanus]QPG75821.1 hypothetical protein FOA43_003183 [Brettanomyces nanus]